MLTERNLKNQIQVAKYFRYISFSVLLILLIFVIYHLNNPLDWYLNYRNVSLKLDKNARI